MRRLANEFLCRNPIASINMDSSYNVRSMMSKYGNDSLVILESKRQASYSYKFQQVGRQSISHTHSCSSTDRHTPGDRRINTYRHTIDERKSMTMTAVLAIVRMRED